MNELIEKLKAHLLAKKDVYVEEVPWCGDTETGFYTEVTFDIDKLMAEIDEFAASFQKAKP